MQPIPRYKLCGYPQVNPWENGYQRRCPGLQSVSQVGGARKLRFHTALNQGPMWLYHGLARAPLPWLRPMRPGVLGP